MGMAITGKRILLVDDDERNLRLLRARLDHLGHELLTAHNGLEALEQFGSQSPDLVLLDLMMPDLDGIEVLQRIRSSEQDKHVPVILVTAHSEKEMRLRGLQAGADEFLEKPVDGPILLARVRTLLALKQSRDELQATLEALATRNAALEQLRREQRELTQFVVHDLKSPLTAVCTNLQWVLQRIARIEPPDLMLSITDAEAAGGRLTSMIEDLLRIATLEESTENLRLELFQLGELLRPVVQSFAGRAQQKDIRLLAPDPPACNVLADRAVLRRVLENMLDNSLKYTPAHGRVQVLAEHRGHVEVLVANDGPGIPASERSRIFEKFTRGSSHPPAAGSAGLGLYFCKRAIEANGGQISLCDDPEWSTCFRIQLPPADASASPD
jgi:two-component system, sensor histidine kinase and response regulator